MSRCDAPVPWDALVAYWAGDLPAGEQAALEEHLIACARCSVESGRVAAITETLRAMIPAVVNQARVDRLRSRGLRIRESAFGPGDRRDELFGRDVDLLIFRLGGLDLSRATRVELAMRDEASGRILTAATEAEFDADAGAVLLCCQRHYEALPPDVVVEVRVHDRGGGERAATYTILHHFE